MSFLTRPLDTCTTFCTTVEVPDYPKWQSCQIGRHGIIHYTVQDYKTYTVYLSQVEQILDFGYYTNFGAEHQYVHLRAVPLEEHKHFLRRVQSELEAMVMECIL